MARTIAKDHDQKRTLILSEAAEVFAREGIARASMNEVAKSCGISKANIYHYYSSKDALIFGILDSYLSELRDRVCGLDLNGLSAIERFKRVMREFLLAYEGMDNEHKIQSEGLPLLPEHEQDTLKAYQREMVDLVRGILAEASPDVFGQDKALLRDVTMSVFGMLNWYYMWHPKAKRQDREAYADTVAALTFNGIQGLGSAST